MKVDIDISVLLSPMESYGVVNGSLELGVMPRIGESISFAFPVNEEVARLAGAWWPKAIVVERVTHTPAAQGTSVLTDLEPLLFESVEQCREFSEYMEKGFGLFADAHSS